MCGSTATGRSTSGVVVGKFNPPHLGHEHLIRTGAGMVDHLYVLLCVRDDQTLSGSDRQRWLEDSSPSNVTVLLTPDDLPPENEPWARRALRLLPRPPDIAFTSEGWGQGWAAEMGAVHVCVDPDRSMFPISGTELRRELGKGFHWLVPAARADLARRVVVIGAESTGKSTLARSLSQVLGTVWVPEHGRSYWEGRRYLGDQAWSSDEFERIARVQNEFERDLARRATGGVVISDTDALVTAVWHRRYLGSVADDLVAGNVPPDLYLVCSPDFPWVQDGTRESRVHREAMHREIVELACTSGAPVEVLAGSPVQRLDRAVELVIPLTKFEQLV